MIGEWEVAFDSTNTYKQNTKMFFYAAPDISIEIGGEAKFDDHLSCSIKIVDDQLVFHYDKNAINVDYDRSGYILKIYDPQDHTKYIELTKITRE